MFSESKSISRKIYHLISDGQFLPLSNIERSVRFKVKHLVHGDAYTIAVTRNVLATCIDISYRTS